MAARKKTKKTARKAPVANMKASRKTATRTSASTKSATRKTATRKTAKRTTKKPAPTKRPVPRRAKPVPAPAPVAPPVWVWHELMTTDVAAATSFYGRLFGWTSRSAEVPGVPYTLFSSGGRDVGGCMAVPGEDGKTCCPPMWLSYLHVEDVDDTVRRAVELGALVDLPPHTIPGVGRISCLRDPAGVAFAVYKPDMAT